MNVNGIYNTNDAGVRPSAGNGGAVNANPVSEITRPETQLGHDNLAYVHDEENKEAVKEDVNGGLQLPLGKTSKEAKGKTPKLDEPILYTQILGAIAASSCFLTIGMLISLPSVTLPLLTDPNSDDITLDTSQAAIYSSIVHIGAILGSMVSGAMNHWLGQRVTLLITLSFVLFLWVGLVFSPFVWLILLIRLLQGAAQGFVGVASINYVIEIAHSSLRGRLSGVNDTCRQLGYLLVYIIGSFNLSWRQICLVSGMVTTIPPFLGLILLPNSPRWLVTHGRIEEARKALAFYRGSSFDVDGELSAIIDQQNKISSSQMGIKEQLKQMGSQDIYPRILFLSLLMVLITFTGNIAIATYSVPIFQAAGKDINPYSSAIMVGSIRVAGIIGFLMIIDRFERKTLLIITSITCSVCLFTTGLFFFLRNQGTDVSLIPWLPLASILLYTPNAVAMQSLASLLRSELFPTTLRALGCSLMLIIFFLSLFASIHTFPHITEIAGEEGTFWMFFGSCILLVIVVILMLPKTKGLSLEEIDEKLRNKIQNSHLHSTKEEIHL